MIETFTGQMFIKWIRLTDLEAPEICLITCTSHYIFLFDVDSKDSYQVFLFAK